MIAMEVSTFAWGVMILAAVGAALLGPEILRPLAEWLAERNTRNIAARRHGDRHYRKDDQR